MRRPLSDGIFLEGERIVFAQGGANLFSTPLTGISSLRGTHNAQNAACAFAAAHALGISYEQIAAALKTFPGLAHRMEEVGARAQYSSSTIPRRRMPTPPRGRSRVSPRFSGSPEENPRKAGFPVSKAISRESKRRT
jgi:hypothetical protein